MGNTWKGFGTFWKRTKLVRESRGEHVLKRFQLLERGKTQQRLSGFFRYQERSEANRREK